jgi:hypothetical protein
MDRVGVDFIPPITDRGSATWKEKYFTSYFVLLALKTLGLCVDFCLPYFYVSTSYFRTIENHSHIFHILSYLISPGIASLLTLQNLALSKAAIQSTKIAMFGMQETGWLGGVVETPAGGMSRGLAAPDQFRSLGCHDRIASATDLQSCTPPHTMTKVPL